MIPTLDAPLSRTLLLPCFTHPFDAHIDRSGGCSSHLPVSLLALLAGV